MEKKNEYELSEIILGTRKLYQGNQKDLNLLKKLSTPTKKNVQDFYYYIPDDPRKGPVLHCNYTKNQNALQKGMSKVKDFVVGIALDENIGHCEKDEEGIYTITGTYGKKFPVEIKSPITFGRIATELLDSEFVQRIRLEKAKEFGHIYSIDGKSNLSLSQCNIRQYSFRNGPGTLDSSVTYYPYTDTILLTSFDEKLSTEKIGSILKVKFESDKLDKYHIDSITTSEILEKPIVFERVNPCSMVEYKIVEEENQVVLSKVMSKR